jgi:hypothetical protein
MGGMAYAFRLMQSESFIGAVIESASIALLGNHQTVAVD